MYRNTYLNKKITIETLNNIKELSLYEIDSNLVLGDELLTLLTCEYSQENGRFVVVAKKVS